MVTDWRYPFGKAWPGRAMVPKMICHSEHGASTARNPLSGAAGETSLAGIHALDEDEEQVSCL